MTGTEEAEKRCLRLIGEAVVGAQRVELALYMIAAHLPRLPGIQGDRRLRELNIDSFFKEDPESFKATLGALVDALGDPLALKSDELVQYVKDRNLIVHNLVRVYRNPFGDTKPSLEEEEAFLLNFLERTVHWIEVVCGLLRVVEHTLYEKRDDFENLIQQNKSVALYFEQVCKYRGVD